MFRNDGYLLCSRAQTVKVVVSEETPAMSVDRAHIMKLSCAEPAKERVLVTTLTKRLSEDLASYMSRKGVRCKYLHSDITKKNKSKSPVQKKRC